MAAEAHASAQIGSAAPPFLFEAMRSLKAAILSAGVAGGGISPRRRFFSATRSAWSSSDRWILHGAPCRRRASLSCTREPLSCPHGSLDAVIPSPPPLADGRRPLRSLPAPGSRPCPRIPHISRLVTPGESLHPPGRLLCPRIMSARLARSLGSSAATPCPRLTPLPALANDGAGRAGIQAPVRSSGQPLSRAWLVFVWLPSSSLPSSPLWSSSAPPSAYSAPDSTDSAFAPSST